MLVTFWVVVFSHITFTAVGSTDEAPKNSTVPEKTDVKKDDLQNLTCSVESPTPSHLTCTRLDGEKDLQNNNKTATLVLQMRDEPYGYNCEHAATISANITGPQIIQNSSHCVLQSNILTCVCSCHGPPLPTITWPLVRNSSNYCINTSVSDSMVNSTMTLPANNYINNAVKCVCKNKDGNQTMKLYLKEAPNDQNNPTVNTKPNVKKDDFQNLTCSVESPTPSHLKCTRHDGTKDLQNGDKTTTLVPQVREKPNGTYVCEHVKPNAIISANITGPPRIQTSSHCVLQSESLTCVCSCHGPPLPTITWPLVRNSSNYCINTSVSDSMVNSTMTLPANYINNAVKCVCKNKDGNQTMKLTVNSATDATTDFLSFVMKYAKLETILAFFIGVVLSATICCLTRCKKKAPRGAAKGLEMVNVQEQQAPMGQEGDVSGEGIESGGEQANEEPTDMNYASIDFSLLASSPEKPLGTHESEYAEVKKEKHADKALDGSLDGIVLGQVEEDEALLPKDDNLNMSKPMAGEEKVEELYSTVNDIMS